MRYIKIVLFLFGMSMIMQSYAAMREGKLDITITGVKNNKGVVRIAVYNSRQAYNIPDDTGAYAFRKAAAPIQNNQAHWVFNNVPFGVYAIKDYHDVNLSNKLPRNLFGVPKIDFGFSNNISAKFGEPSYMDAKFNFDEKKLPIFIQMQ